MRTAASPRPILGFLGFVLWTGLLAAQSSNATLTGKVTDARTGKPIHALVIWHDPRTGGGGYTRSNLLGFYSFPALPPGRYTVRADAVDLGLQGEARTGVELQVGGATAVDFQLAPVNAAAAGLTSPATPSSDGMKKLFLADYGIDGVPDVKTVVMQASLTDLLTGSVSTVIDELKIQELPYSGRDVYTLLVLQPGVSSDNATGKGLGLSVNGQRVSGTNFLLDGVDNNDPLLTGPAVRVPAEAVEEYRMTTNSFSAEYGRATAFIANAVTRTGGNAFHGVAYGYFNHDRLNANTFANNTLGIPRSPLRFHQAGGMFGGPLRRERLFFLASFERAYSSSQSFEQPSPAPGFQVPLLVPSRAYIDALPAQSLARQLLRDFAPPPGRPVAGYPLLESISTHFPLVQRNTQFLGRVDYHPPLGSTRVGVRYAISQNTSDDFLWSVYAAFRAPFVIRDQNVAVNLTTTRPSGRVNEFKTGYTDASTALHRPHPEIPNLIAAFDGATLPGSAANYDYQYADRLWHVVDNYSLSFRNHRLILGFEARRLFDDSTVTPFAAGIYTFSDLPAFAAGTPGNLEIAVDRFTGRPLPSSAYRRKYVQHEAAGFLQDNWSVNSRLTVNLGLRYEYFGVPSRVDDLADWNLQFGAGSNLVERLAAAQFRRADPFRPDRNNFAPRLGFALRLKGGSNNQGSWILRGGYGISYDRIFDKVWQDLRNNSLGVAELGLGQAPPRFTLPARDSLLAVNPTFGSETTVMVDQNLRTPYAQHWFMGVQYQARPHLLLEVNQVGSAGRKLIAFDDINRAYSRPDFGRILPTLGEVSYRANQGSSSYVSLQVSARKDFERGLAMQMSYTWSRARDNQSDPFRNPNLQLNYSLPAASRLGDPGLLGISHAVFTQQSNSSLDRGLSDFDQDHNLVWNGIAQAPQRWNWWMRDWQVSGIAGIRSGFPFTVTDGASYISASGVLIGNRPNLKGDLAAAKLASAQAVAGGLVLLDRSKFEHPSVNQVGNLPRNAFRGPGFWNLDLGLSRTLHFGKQESRAQFRADFFNLFNHTNLGNPVTEISAPNFGYAAFGRTGFGGSLPSVTPLNELPRRVQFSLKVFF